MNTQNARVLRKNCTVAESKLWQILRDKRLKGHKFRRQEPMGEYIVDFVCFENKLIIEVDGGQHQEQKNYDEARTNWLNSQGFRVLRFWNNEVLGSFQAVKQRIWDNLS